MKNSKNKKLVFLLYTIIALFLGISLYLVYFQLFKANPLNNDSRNARNFIDENIVKRGTIYDKNGLALAYSEKVDDSYERINRYNYMYSNIIGYNSNKYGKSGIEASYNSDLLNINKNKDFFTKIDSLIKPDNGNDIYLTIDDNLQSYAYDALGDLRGSVIVSNPSTGKILAMVSKPSFNVNNIDEDWDWIINSNDGELLNRPTQGHYEPGSIFKTLTSLVFLRSNMDLNYYDSGEATINGHSVYNFNNAIYGEMNLEKALNVSANTYFYEKSQLVSNSDFRKAILDFGIGKNFNFPLAITKSTFPFVDTLSAIDKANAAFGQGQTYVNPLDMSLIVNGIANNGIVNKPILVDKVVRSGIEIDTKQEILSSEVESQYVNIIKSYMKSTAEYNDYTSYIYTTLAAKTGTAENGQGSYNTWFMGISPVDNPKYTIVITIEHQDEASGNNAAPIGAKILDYAVQNIE
ncbi:MAG: penicillin-binding transpeptidase domain-containing protein [Helcococcus sp.]|nr:penicillin-binding transpeptidase domain-containing protein [Helcococcus sp.]